MKIVIAPDSFKGSLSSVEVVTFVEAAIRAVDKDAEIVRLPIADGGEGTVEAFRLSVGGEADTETVTGPLGQKVQASYCILPDGTAVIEMAQASGLTLLREEELDPVRATTYGTGELIRHALDRGCRQFIIGIGGSATNDGGAGMARALGARFLDRAGRELPPGGGALDRLDRIDCDGLDRRLYESRFLVASDVSNVLCGPEGATAVYGPQKGVTPQLMDKLDGALANYARVIRDQLGIDVADRPAAGAAGGLGAGLMAFCRAQVRPGIDIVLDAARFEEALEGADLVITGEGRVDGQSAQGKVPFGVATRVKRFGPIPVVALAGCIGEGAERLYDCGVDAIVPISDGSLTVKESMARAGELVKKTAEKLIRNFESAGTLQV
ncbi:MAG: glycerate kinase [Oscillospiraceae bacterium]|nr:glycerate kinase [Oscillospiraceae bacterium]